jgi:transposase
MTAHCEVLRVALIAAYAKCGSYTAVARQYAVDVSTVRRWVQRQKARVPLKDKPRSGRPRILSTPAANQAAMDLMKSGRTASRVAKDLHTQGLAPRVVHKATLIRAAREAARHQGYVLAAHTGKPARQLTALTKQKRLAFAQANLHTDWSRVMFTDRKRFLFRYPATKVHRCQWVKKGSKPEAHAVSNPQCVNVYAGITKASATACRLVAGTSKHKTTYKTQTGGQARNITRHEYKDVLQDTLLREGGRLLGGSRRRPWVLQQDNDPAHGAASATIATWNKGHTSNCKLLDNWPPNSPDLNPIENVWAWVDKRVQAMGCFDFDQFQAAVLEVIKAVPGWYLANLYDSMPRRIEKVIERGGDKLKH